MGIVGPGGGGGGGITEGEVLQILAGTKNPGAIKTAGIAANQIVTALIAGSAVTGTTIAGEAVSEGNLVEAVRKLLAKVAAWTDLKTTLGAKVEAGTRGVLARIEGPSAGQFVRLRGEVLVKNLEELKAGETLLTLPEGFRPANVQEIIAGTGNTATILLVISPTGVITIASVVKEKKSVELDGIDFPLN